MLVECPRCDARYEIDDALIPAAGRSVQCSSCDHVWSEVPDRTVPAERAPLDPSVRAILREEAEHEARVRRERGLVALPAAGGGAPEPAARPDAAGTDAALRAASAHAADLHDAPPEPRSRFGPGVAFGLVLVGLLVGVYLAAAAIAAAVPAAAPALDAYTSAADGLRAGLADLVGATGADD